MKTSINYCFYGFKGKSTLKRENGVPAKKTLSVRDQSELRLCQREANSGGFLEAAIDDCFKTG